MKPASHVYTLLLLLTSAIWGFAFVAQRVGSHYIGPFTFNGIRFFLGAISLIPLALFLSRSSPAQSKPATPGKKNVSILTAGLLLGCFLFTGATLQQIGLYGTSVSNAAFITGLYIVLVPLFGIFTRQKPPLAVGIGAGIAFFGLYFLCIPGRTTISWGDLLELAGAVFWSIHILLVGRFSPRFCPVRLSIIQFATCGAISLVCALFLESFTVSDFMGAAVPLAYSGFCSVGIAYTIQVFAQKNIHPARASIVMSLETVFAALGGYVLLGENMSVWGFWGCFLMLVGMVVSQLPGKTAAREVLKEAA